MTVAYAGIGTRQATPEDVATIKEIAGWLAAADIICYSGNALGSDNAFQVGSGHLCVLWLPNITYNQDVYHPKLALDARVACSSPESLAFFEAHKPPRKADSPNVQSLLRRNYHIIHGDNIWPRAKFVIYNANEFAGNIPGGTRYGVAAAKEAGIPVVNIRWPGWRDRLHFILNNIPDDK